MLAKQHRAWRRNLDRNRDRNEQRCEENQAHEIDHEPFVSLTDDQYKLVYSRLGERLRVAGTAELSGYGLEINRSRCLAILDKLPQSLEILTGRRLRRLNRFW
jgi:D-amino-acid dehydrogenase